MREMQKVVIHYLDGSVVRARVRFFSRVRRHLEAEDLSGQPLPVDMGSLKAIFFVREYGGLEGEEPLEGANPTRGESVSVRFPDGEVIEGLVSDYPPTGPGFYLTPIPQGGNNRVLFVPAGAPLEVRRLPG